MAPEPLITDITRVIQLAVAPVFLLTAVGTILVVLTNRLARAVDRSRIVEAELSAISNEEAAVVREDLRVLLRRIDLVNAAIALAVLCALLICLLIATAFIGAFLSVDLSRTIATLFVLAMLALIGCLVVFLREIFLAVTTAHRSIR